MTAAASLTEFVQTNVLSRMWWAILLRAIALLAFGACAYFWLGGSLASVTLLFAAYALVDGAASLIAAVRGGGVRARLAVAFTGAASLAAAGAALLPHMTWTSLAFVFAGWAIVRGAFEFISALSLRKYLDQDWSLALVGVLSVAFGVGVLITPAIEPPAFIQMVSTYALVTGLLLALLAVRCARGFRL
jgi:uncharacterized membrane protein HdeD (DUF308 family)